MHAITKVEVQRRCGRLPNYFEHLFHSGTMRHCYDYNCDILNSCVNIMVVMGFMFFKIAAICCLGFVSLRKTTNCLGVVFTLLQKFRDSGDMCELYSTGIYNITSQPVAK